MASKCQPLLVGAVAAGRWLRRQSSALFSFCSPQNPPAPGWRVISWLASCRDSRHPVFARNAKFVVEPGGFATMVASPARDSVAKKFPLTALP
jgi:hypothetical protein